MFDFMWPLTKVIQNNLLKGVDCMSGNILKVAYFLNVVGADGRGGGGVFP